MADIFSSIYQDPTEKLRKVVDSTNNGGRSRSSGSAVVLNDAQVDDRVLVVKLPGAARLLPGGKIAFSDLGAGVTLDAGFVNPDPAKEAAAKVALATGLDASAAGVEDLSPAVAAGDMSKRLFQLAGFDKDPGQVDVIITIKGAATTAADKDLHTEVPWVHL